ncbi:MAG TPA: DUF2911 domain-containing protein [Flavisolibacter sp.]|nr:DUF2911 domain-containing protein [Flavisolibacter sp.]
MNSKHFFSFLLALFVTAAAWAQTDKSNRASPPATTTGKIGDANITINYSSPSVKGRKIWGELVPYGQAWRAGANEATVFQTDKTITVEGKQLPAGNYSLFAIPGENEWQFIFNAEIGQWGVKRTGEANRDPAKDVLTVTVKPTTASAMSERLVYDVTTNGFVFRWENMEVPVSIQ